jgi:hypothetical protein
MGLVIPNISLRRAEGDAKLLGWVPIVARANAWEGGTHILPAPDVSDSGHASGQESESLHIQLPSDS